MPITVADPLAERGKKDARRHREKQREAIRARLPEIISEEAIITGRRGKTVKVPIRSIDIPHFRPGSRKRSSPMPMTDRVTALAWDRGRELPAT